MIDRLNAYLTMCWDHSLALHAHAPTHIEASVRTVTDLYGAGPVVTRLTREVARLQRQIAALERQLVFANKHFAAQPVQQQPASPQLPKNEPEMVTDEADPLVIAAYREQFPNHRIVVVPVGSVPHDDSTDHLPPAPRRAA